MHQPARVPLAAALAALAALAACGDAARRGAEPRVRVVASTRQVGDVAARVGGTRVAVTVLVAPGADPHRFAADAADPRTLREADLVLRSGGSIDDWLPALVRRADGAPVPVDLSKSVILRERRGAVDPHWWQDPANLQAAVRKVRDELIKADPDGSTPYRANAERLRRALVRVDRSVADCLARVPAPRRRLVTAHAAFGYLAARYGLTVAGAVIPSLSTRDAAPGDPRRIVRAIRARRAPAVFAERGVDPAAARAAARAAGVPLAGPLAGDALGPPGAADATVLGALAANARKLAAALGGDPQAC